MGKIQENILTKEKKEKKNLKDRRSISSFVLIVNEGHKRVINLIKEKSFNKMKKQVS